MSDKKEPDSIKKSTYLFIIGVIFYALFNQFVWEKYVYTPTASDALEIGDQPATIGEIDKKCKLAISTSKDTVQLFTIVDKFLGWKVVDELVFPLERNAQQDTPYTIYQEKMKLQKNKQINLFVVIVRDTDIWDVEVVDKKGQQHGMNGVPQEGIKIRYMWSENEFAEEATYYMYSYDEELLYTENGQWNYHYLDM